MPGRIGLVVTPFSNRGNSSRLALISRAAHILPVLLLLLLACLVTGTACAQGVGDVTDVHVQPRGKDAKPESDAMHVDAATAAATAALHQKPMIVDVNMVLVPVTVTDPMNRLVTGLDKENFQVYDSNQQQMIKSFSSEDEPISLGVIFDLSGSMSNKIDKSKQAVVEFFKTANPQDEFFIITFNNKPELLSDWTTSVEDIEGKLVYSNPKGRTALLDAIYLGMDKMKSAHHSKKALLVISDGGDNSSRYTEGELKSLVREADVQIYSIGIFDQSAASTEERYGPYMLNEISENTGGRLFRIDDPNELADVATKIGIELRNQYVIGYHPNNPARDGKWRKIKVKLNPPKGLPPLIVHAKTGYYAPSE